MFIKGIRGRKKQMPCFFYIYIVASSSIQLINARNFNILCQVELFQNFNDGFCLQFFLFCILSVFQFIKTPSIYYHFDAFLANIGPIEIQFSCLYMKKENKFSCLFDHNVISNGLIQANRNNNNNIVAKKTTQLVLLFHKKTNKVVFLQPNMGQKSIKVLSLNIDKMNSTP